MKKSDPKKFSCNTGNESPRKISYISSKGSISYISGNGTFLDFSYISGRNFPSQKNDLKKFLIF